MEKRDAAVARQQILFRESASGSSILLSKPHSAVATDVNGWSCDEVVNLVLAFETKRAAKYLIAIFRGVAGLPRTPLIIVKDIFTDF